ncbi:TPA: phage tail family protein [Enterococcus faecium]|jgi:phage-related protein|uniref:phage tail family protein n=1 Tax=Enterococcus faecium TaxID=1352 RepID=UPI0022EA035E|nr:phage tail family protein [Enterococcus faecium]MDN3036383.1 phage tail family protein [Enterococcus faecium]HAZ0563235.1 phage tail family protein [Enterococcus faecium]HBL2296020.1 phage tail family protein [Enterococcus faecium]HBL2920219.1 phage tail family protein [Enterococcus faecium]HBL2939619.1 phage tail family protein [Enterococcus faecium]
MNEKTRVYLAFSDEIVELTNNSYLRLIDINIGMPVAKNEFVEFSGTNGKRLSNSSFDAFPITLSFDIRSREQSMFDLVLQKTELRELFTREPEFYLIYSKEPGKKYRVVYDSIDDERKGAIYTRYTVNLGAIRGYSESIATTLTDFNLEEEWQFSQGLVAEDYKYTHQTSHFIIYNAGSFEIDPREHYLRIALEGESEGNLTIFNKTTGDRFIYYPSLSTNLGQTLVLDGVYPKLNSVSCGIDTNHGLITLAEGVNEIEIQNITRVKSSWDFRFLYK